MDKITILVLEKEQHLYDLYSRMLRQKHNLNLNMTQARDLESAIRHFRALKEEIKVIVVSTCSNCQSELSAGFVKIIRKEGFEGLAIATSGTPVFRDSLVQAGCDFQCEKIVVPDKIYEYLLNENLLS
jgi:hypothetical protein